jgi:hypothetical protein
MTPLVSQAAITRLTTSEGEDIEPSVGPVVQEYRFARPNGQLAYASNRDDGDTVNDDTPENYRTGRFNGRNPAVVGNYHF